MILPCSASLQQNPQNKVGHYITNLARPVDLDGQWEVGLAEVILPPPKICLRSDVKVYYRKDGPSPEWSNFYIRKGCFKDYKEFQEHIENFVPVVQDEQEKYSQLFYVTFDKDKVSLFVSDHYVVWFESEEFCRLLGCVENRWYNDAWSFTSGNATTLVYLYCDIVEHGYVGDTLAPCLRIIPVYQQENVFTIESYENPHYVPVLKNTFSSIEIEMADDLGNEVQFGTGLSLVKLHFRLKKKWY